MKRYRVWAGNPKGVPEDKTRCVVNVPDRGRSVLSHQCRRKRGYGENGDRCKQHIHEHLWVPKDDEL